MSQLRKIFVVLPAYNEEKKISRLISSIAEVLKPFSYSIVIVDDGSKDQTPQIVVERKRSLPIQSYIHPRNLGLGATIRDGLKYASQQANPQDIIITMDADDTHPPEEMLKMIPKINEGFDVVIASRYVPGARVVGVPFHRQILSNGASFLFQLACPIKGVRDYTCGYRAYRADVIQKAFQMYNGQFIVEQGFQCMVEILLKLRKTKPLFTEVPFNLRYDLKSGVSKMPVLRTVANTLWLLVKYRFK